MFQVKARIGNYEWGNDTRFYATYSLEISIAVSEVDENAGILAFTWWDS